MIKRIGFIFIIMAFFVSCQNNREDSSADFEIPDSLKNYQGELEVSGETMNEFIENVSNPVEMAAVMMELDVPYSNNYIASTDQVDDYITDYKKAVNLGILGADLGYLNTYNKTSVVLDYITAIKNLADELNVGQFFDFRTLKRLVTNKSDLDSLMFISVQSFNQMDEYLRENNRGSISTLLVTGVWIEAMYQATQIVQDHPDDRIKELIGDQKTVISFIMVLLENYKKIGFFEDLGKEFRELKDIYDDVKITIEVTEPKPVVIDGVLTFESADRSTIEIDDATLKAIVAKVEKIRKNVISV